MPIPQVNDRIKEAPVVVLRAVFAGIGQLLLTADKVRSRAADQVWMPERATVPGPDGQTQSFPGPHRPRNGTVHTKPAVTERPVMRGAAASPGTATAPAASAAPVAKAAKNTATAKITPVVGTTRTAPAGKTAAAPKAAAAPESAKTAPAAKTTRTAKTAPAAKTTPATKTTAAPEKAKTAPAAKAGPAAKPKTGTAPRTTKSRPAEAAPPMPGYDDLSLASLRARLRTLDAPTIRAMLAYEQAHARREPVITMLERRLAKISAG